MSPHTGVLTIGSAQDRDLFKHGGTRSKHGAGPFIWQEFIGLLVPLCPSVPGQGGPYDRGGWTLGQLRCDGRTLKYETVVGYFELEELWDTF